MLRQEDEFPYVLEKVRNLLLGGNPVGILSAYLPVRCMSQIDHQLGLPDLYAKRAVDVCIADAWNESPCALLRLLTPFPPEPILDTIRERIATPPRFSNPHQAQVLHTEMPFWNRDSLRNAAKALNAPRAVRPILVVNGAEDSGKSYTYDYIEHLHFAEVLQFKPFKIEFDDENGSLIGPEELARDILSSMGVAVDKLPVSFFAKDTNGERWYYNLAGKILTEGEGARFWIVLDNFSGGDVRADTLKLIDCLAQRILGSTVFAERFRLILIHFDRSFLTVQPQKVELDETKAVADLHVRECIMEIFGRFSSGSSEERLQATFTGIMAGLPSDERLREINARLNDLILSLKGKGTNGSVQ